MNKVILNKHLEIENLKYIIMGCLFELIVMGKDGVEKYHCSYKTDHPYKKVLNDFIKEAHELYSSDDVRSSEILVNKFSIYKIDKYALF